MYSPISGSLHQPEQRIEQQVKDRAQRHPGRKREHRAEIGPPAGAFGIAFAECARDHRIDADHDPDAEARKRDGDREDETHRSEFLRAELADEIGVDQADRHDCRNAEDHRQRLSHQMAADTAAG